MLAKANLNIQPERLADFCRRWKVTELALFGSVLREDFHPESDVDVLVTFADGAGWSLFDLVRMQDELQEVIGREVDLVERDALRNPFRRHSILGSMEVVYGSGGA
jgi:hypothetical protein